MFMKITVIKTSNGKIVAPDRICCPWILDAPPAAQK
jgi:hypothetical protein